jgi:hypothetical protein
MYGIIRTILVEKHSADIETETDRFTIFNLGPGKSFQVFLRKADDGVSGHFSFGHRSAEKPLLTLHLRNRDSVLTEEDLIRIFDSFGTIMAYEAYVS